MILSMLGSNFQIDDYLSVNLCLVASQESVAQRRSKWSVYKLFLCRAVYVV